MEAAQSGTCLPAEASRIPLALHAGYKSSSVDAIHSDMPTKTKVLKPSAAARKAPTRPRACSRSGAAHYDAIRERLERDHHGAYVMINTATADYVVAPTTSQVHAAFIKKFGESAPGWCTRIGTSVFATA
jgi:hypothetical protein